MRITVSSLGRFHAFDLAEQMQQRGCLAHLYTAYPAFKVNPSLRSACETFPWLLAIQSLFQRLQWHQAASWLTWPAVESFDRWVATRIQPCDVFVHLSSFGLHTARKAKQLGAHIVCDRGSSHIEYQNEILTDEYARQNVPYRSIDARIVDKELQEYQEADIITVPSNFAYHSFIKKGVSAEKLRKLPYGVNLSLFHPVQKEDDRFRVLFAGGYTIRKGISYLFDAIRPLVKRGILELWLVGNPEPAAREILRRNADLFTNKGTYPRHQLAWFYSQASVLILPSLEEGLALVQAQAMACGVPVVATENTGAEDLFTDGVEGFIVPIRDATAIRHKIEWMLDNPVKRQEMGQAALRRVRALGGWTEYGNQALAIYSQLLNSSIHAPHG
jgi:glycosyltransferase involved in cell wall biosynthesis